MPETVVAVLERDPIPPRELRPEVPKELETICLKCLEKSPQDRYPSAAALADELDRYLQGEVIDATTLDSAPAALEPPRARAGRAARRPLARRPDRPVQLLLSVADPDFWHHYTIQGVLALWAALGRHFPGDAALGLAVRQVRVLWSAADIAFLTIEIKLFEQFVTGIGFDCRGPCRDDACSWAIPS